MWKASAGFPASGARCVAVFEARNGRQVGVHTRPPCPEVIVGVEFTDRAPDMSKHGDAIRCRIDRSDVRLEHERQGLPAFGDAGRRKSIDDLGHGSPQGRVFESKGVRDAVASKPRDFALTPR